MIGSVGDVVYEFDVTLNKLTIRKITQQVYNDRLSLLQTSVCYKCAPANKWFHSNAKSDYHTLYQHILVYGSE